MIVKCLQNFTILFPKKSNWYDWSTIYFVNNVSRIWITVLIAEMKCSENEFNEAKKMKHLKFGYIPQRSHCHESTKFLFRNRFPTLAKFQTRSTFSVCCFYWESVEHSKSMIQSAESINFVRLIEQRSSVYFSSRLVLRFQRNWLDYNPLDGIYIFYIALMSNTPGTYEMNIGCTTEHVI